MRKMIVTFILISVFTAACDGGVLQKQVSAKSRRIKVDDYVLSVAYDSKNDDGKFSFVSSFNRSWNLGQDVDVNKIVANHEDGILTITVPKPEAKKRVVRTIKVG